MPACNPIKFSGIHFEFSFSYHKTKEFDCCNEEITFVGLDKEIAFLTFLKYFASASNKLFEIGFLSTYKKIVHIDFQPVLNKLLRKDVIHHCLKCFRRICNTKEHHKRFKRSFTTSKCHFPFVSFLDTDIVITPTNIHLNITIVFRKIIDQFINARKWISIAYCLGVKIMIVLYGVKVSIFFWNKEEGGG